MSANAQHLSPSVLMSLVPEPVFSCTERAPALCLLRASQASPGFHRESLLGICKVAGQGETGSQAPPWGQVTTGEQDRGGKPEQPPPPNPREGKPVPKGWRSEGQIEDNSAHLLRVRSVLDTAKLSCVHLGLTASLCGGNCLDPISQGRS